MTEQEWLAADNHKILLVDISYHNGTTLSTKYFSDYPYIQGFGDTFINILGNTVSSIAYEDIVLSISKITTKINSSKSLGNITLLNTTGEYDNLLDITNAWEGHTIKIYMGDPKWVRSQFIQILEGVIQSLTAPQPHLLSLNIRDKKEVLNVSVQEDVIWNTSNVLNYLNDNTNLTGLYDKFPTIFSKKLYGSTGTYINFDKSLGVIPEGIINSTVPICLGKVFNIEPVLIDSYNYVYQIHESPDSTNYGISVISEVRSNGVKLTGINDSYVDTLVPNTSGTPEAGLTVSTISGNTITVTGADFTTNGYARAVIHNTTLDEARYVISSASSTVVDVDANAQNQSAQVAGWTTGHTYNIWYPGVSTPTIYILQYEENLQAGCIRLLVSDQSTQITCDIIGQTSRTQYTNTTVIPGIISHSAAFIIEYLALEKSSLTVVDANNTDICPDTFNPSGSNGFTNTDNIGIYIKNEDSVLNMVVKVITSLGGYIRFDRLCLLQLFRFVDPSLEVPLITITADNIIEKGLSLKTIELPEKSINLGYKKNWTIQDKGAIAASVVESGNIAFLDSITSAFSNIIKDTGVTNSQYPLITDSDLVESLIYNSIDASTEAIRRATIRSTKRYIYRVDTTAAPFTLSVGDVIKIQNTRYGFLYPGKNVIIIGLEEYPTDKRVTLEVWV